MTAIGPGDWAECIDARGFPECVTVGIIYLVEDVVEVGAIPCLVLRGVIHSRGFRKVRADCFRPIYRPKSGLIEGLKKPVFILVEDTETIIEELIK